MPVYPSWLEIVIIVVMAACEFLFCAFPAVIWASVGRQRLVEAFSWRRASGREYVGAALLGLGFIPWVQTLIVIQNQVWPRGMANQATNNAFMLPLLLHHPVLMTLALPLSAAFCEEIFFRGPLQRALLKRLPVWLAMGLASVLFAAVHFDLQGFLVRTILGILLAVLVLRGRSIFPAMMMHFVYDAAALGGAAWGIHQEGLEKVMRLSARADMGVGRTELIVGPVLGTLLLAVGWGLCVSAWRRRREGHALDKAGLDGSQSVWPPASELSSPNEPE